MKNFLLLLLSAPCLVFLTTVPAFAQETGETTGCEAGAWKELSNLMRGALCTNPELERFYGQLSSQEKKDKKQIIRFLLDEYPVVITGNLNKERHHHQMLILDSSQVALLGQRVRVSNEDWIDYDFRIPDLRYFGLEAYDPVRYIWWNPDIENFRDPKHLPGYAGHFGNTLSPLRAGKTALISWFKLSMDRSAAGIRSLYDLWGDAWYALFSRDLFRSLHLNETVDRLILAREWNDKGDPKGFQAAINNLRGGPESQSYFTSEPGYYWDNSWYYTFWNRRKSEQNEDVVLEILREVQKHYK